MSELLVERVDPRSLLSIEIREEPFCSPDLDLSQENRNYFELDSPEEVIEYTVDKFMGRVAVATSGGWGAGMMLKLVSDIAPEAPVINIRHGYETERTLELIDFYKSAFDLNLIVEGNPKTQIPPDDSEEFEAYQLYAKVEPFQRALRRLRPCVFFSGVMRWQSEEREDMPYIERRGAVYKVNPLRDVTELGVKDFLARHNLPQNDDYFDPTKGSSQKMECQLNTSEYDWEMKDVLKQGKDF